MSKITKKQLHNGWYCHNTEIIKMKKELRELKQSVLRLEKLTDEKLLDEPQPKQLDQSVFDGAHEMWRFASVDADGAGFRFADRPELTDRFWRNVNCSKFDRLSQSGTYDASNWQNSLIERDDIAKELLEVDLSSELTGSDLALELLKNQRYIIASVSDVSDADAIECGNNKLIHESSEDIFTDDMGGIYCWAVALNNQGEPLTASEVGL